MTYSAPTRTVAEVMTAVKRQFGDESGVQLEDSDIIRWVNDAQDAIVTKNKVLKAKSTTQSVAGQANYTLPNTDIHQIESIHYNNYRIPNMSFAEAEEHIYRADPINVVLGDPVLWYEWANQITFWPIPTDVKNIDIFYTKRPAKVTSSADTLSVPDKYFQDVLMYVLTQAYEMDEDLYSSQVKSQQFSASLDEKGEEERTAQNMTYSVITTYDWWG